MPTFFYLPFLLLIPGVFSTKICWPQYEDQSKDKATHFFGRQPFELKMSSACVRCDLCIAIAKKINETLISEHEKFSTWRLSDNDVSVLLRKICDEAFRNYALRQVNEIRTVSDRLPNSTLILTTIDRNWNEKLTEKCHELLDYFGTEELYKYWSTWHQADCKQKRAFSLITQLCKNDMGIFRDCKNIA